MLPALAKELTWARVLSVFVPIKPEGSTLLSWSLETAGKVTLIIATAGKDGVCAIHYLDAREIKDTEGKWV